MCETLGANLLLAQFQAYEAKLHEGIQTIYEPYADVVRISDFGEYVPLVYWVSVFARTPAEFSKAYRLWANGLFSASELAAMSKSEIAEHMKIADDNCQCEIVYVTEADESGEM